MMIKHLGKHIFSWNFGLAISTTGSDLFWTDSKKAKYMYFKGSDNLGGKLVSQKKLYQYDSHTLKTGEEYVKYDTYMITQHTIWYLS